MKLNIIVVLLILCAIVGWIVSGELGGSQSVLSKKHMDKPPIVKVVESHLIRTTDTFNTFGVTKKRHSVEIFPEVSGIITNIYVDSGDEVKKGMRIIAIDKRSFLENLERAKAGLKKARLEYEVANSLYKSGNGSEINVATTSFALRSAQADLKAAEIDLAHTEIISPIDGRLDKIHVNVGDLVSSSSSKSLVTVLRNNSRCEVTAHIPVDRVKMVKVGAHADLSMVSSFGGVSDGVEKGKVAFVSNIADDKTRTYRVDIHAHVCPAPPGTVINVKLHTGDVMATMIKPSTLDLSTDGKIGVKVLVKNQDNKYVVKFKPIEIISDNQNSIIIKGLNDKDKVITTGHAFVRDGDVVRANIVGVK